MKLYVIMQKATEYNDEYDVPQEGGKIYKAFLTPPTKEQIDAAKWGAIEGKESGYDGWPSDMAYVKEIEVDESQVVMPGEVKIAPQAPPRPATASKPATYAEAQARAAAARVEASTLAKEAIEQGIKNLFDQYPDLESFSWDQYAPYFNDGDECNFSVHCKYPNVKLKGFKPEEGGPHVLYSRVDGSDKVYVLRREAAGSSGYTVFYSYGKRGSSLVEGMKCHVVPYRNAIEVMEQVKEEKIKEGYGCPYDDIVQFLSGIDEDDMKSVFGDDCTVTATRDGTETDGCSHD